MAEFVQTLALGLLIGGVYALMASGLTLVFGVMRVINVAQGAFLVLSAFVTWWVWRATGIDPIALAVLTTPLMFGFGWVFYRLVGARLRSAPPSMSVLLMFGVALLIEGLLNVTAGNRYRSATPGYFDESYTLGPISLPKAPLYGFLAALAVLAAFYAVLNRTWTGRAIRAWSQNPSGAALVGVSAVPTATLAFALGTASTGMGGSVLSVLVPFFPASHYEWIARILGIIVLGGLGSLPGALTGALILGLAEALTSVYVSPQWSILVFYGVIMAVLIVRPQGLFGARVREDVAA